MSAVLKAYEVLWSAVNTHVGTWKVSYSQDDSCKPYRILDESSRIITIYNTLNSQVVLGFLTELQEKYKPKRR